jgi:dolichyl-phosphate beta-glucosyltransferase
MADVTLSVVIPAYKERERIGGNLDEIIQHLGSKDYVYEIIIVIDGSDDGTSDFVRSYENKIEHFSVIDNPLNRGKGAVVRQGLLAARGDYHVFLDADGSTSITHVDEALRLIDQGADFVVGSRDIAGSTLAKRQPLYREIMGTMGNVAIRFVLGLWAFPDTQCGFKVLRSNVTRDVVPRMVVDRFAYDFEMIVLAQKRGYVLEQMPVHWEHEEGTTVGGLFGPNGFGQVLIDLLKTRFRLWLGSYRLKENV